MNNAGIVRRHEVIWVKGIAKPFRIVHVSDVHFSEVTSHEQNQRTMAQIFRVVKTFRGAGLIAVTGDLVSRYPGKDGIPDAVRLMRALRRLAPVALSLGNHETDLLEGQQYRLLTLLRNAGIVVLDNRTLCIAGIHVTGLTLPEGAFRNAQGGYSGLTEITPELVRDAVGICRHPSVLLAHSPMGFEAYAKWGADVVLSGHVHGGIVRIGEIGLLSPERRFLPAYTKGTYHLNGHTMNVSAGIGKLRFNNPAEVICVDLLPESDL